MDKRAPIFVAGHRGLVGSALVRSLTGGGWTNLLTVGRAELDLRDQSAVNVWFDRHRPEYVIVAAGTVGGILANSTRPAEFIYDNLMIHATVVHASYIFGVNKLLYLGSSCIYPRLAAQPMTEEELLTGPLEPTNESYAVAKVAGIKLCAAYRRQYGCDFISAMPTNLYGPNDNFNLESAHVLPALIRKFHEARRRGDEDVTVWGTGSAVREFLHVDDLADACICLLQSYSDEMHINVGTGHGVSIADLARTIGDVVHPQARVVFDTSKPDGMPTKVLDVSRLWTLGWKSQVSLREGLESTYKWYIENEASARR